MAQAAAVAMVAGTVLSAYGQHQQGQDIKAADNYQANQMNAQATQVVAASQKAADNQAIQGDLLESKARAVAAANGAGGDILTIRNNIENETAYRAQTAQYQGADQARALNMNADLKRYEGANAARAANLGAISSVLSSGGGMFAKYGGGGYKANADSGF